MEFPIKIIVELTNDCNLSCPMCPRHYAKMELGYMNIPLFFKICRELDGHEIDSVILCWRGESLMHKDFSEFVTIAKDHHLPLVLATNGTLLREWISLSMMSAINVSIHNRESLDGLSWLISHRGSSIKPRIQASYVEGERTGASPIELSLADEVRSYMRHTIDGRWGKTRLGIGNRNHCSRLGDSIAIAWDGTIGRCCYAWETMPGLNINFMSIKEAWDSSQLHQLRAIPDAVCNECDQWAGNGRTL